MLAGDLDVGPWWWLREREHTVERAGILVHTGLPACDAHPRGVSDNVCCRHERIGHGRTTKKEAAKTVWAGWALLKLFLFSCSEGEVALGWVKYRQRPAVERGVCWRAAARLLADHR